MKLDHFEPSPNGQELAVEKMTVGTLNMCSHDYHSRGKMATAIAHHIQELFIAHGGSNSVHIYFFFAVGDAERKNFGEGDFANP